MDEVEEMENTIRKEKIESLIINETEHEKHKEIVRRENLKDRVSNLVFGLGNTHDFEIYLFGFIEITLIIIMAIMLCVSTYNEHNKEKVKAN